MVAKYSVSFWYSSNGNAHMMFSLDGAYTTETVHQYFDDADWKWVYGAFEHIIIESEYIINSNPNDKQNKTLKKKNKNMYDMFTNQVYNSSSYWTTFSLCCYRNFWWNFCIFIFSCCITIIQYSTQYNSNISLCINILIVILCIYIREYVWRST